MCHNYLCSCITQNWGNEWSWRLHQSLGNEVSCGISTGVEYICRMISSDWKLQWEWELHFLMIPLRWAVFINWSSEYSGRCYYIIFQLLDIFKDGLIGIMLAIKLFTDIGIWVLGSVFLWEKMGFSYRRITLAWTVFNSFVHWSEQKKSPGLFQRGPALQILQLIPSWIAWELAGIWTRYPAVDLLHLWFLFLKMMTGQPSFLSWSFSCCLYEAAAPGAARTACLMGKHGSAIQKEHLTQSVCVKLLLLQQ